MIKPILGAVLVLGLAGCANTQKTPSAAPTASLEPQTPGLDMYTRMTFPPGTETVGEAAEWLLASTGYQVALDCLSCPPEAGRIAADPVSPLATRAELTTVRRGLLLVLGSDARLVVDHKNQLVSFGFYADHEPGLEPEKRSAP